MTAFRQLSDSEKLAYLRLSQTENIGPITFQQLLGRYKTAAAALEALPDLSQSGGRRKPLQIYSAQAAEADLERAAAINAKFVAAGELGYPPNLSHIPSSLPLICVSGNLELANMDCVAIVGARNASAIGMKFTRMIARSLTDAGFLVVSGLARGIDTAAHDATVQMRTAAVLAGGLNYYYPPENQKLQRAIAENGLLISEMPPGTAPKAEYFPRRNRIISGMSRAVIVVEAALRSGSLITARFANEQGRDVFAVPGSPLDPRCEGTNKLIKDGATLLTSANDVIEALGMQIFRQPHYLGEEVAATEITLPDINQDMRERVIQLLSPTPIDTDDLIRESGIAPSSVVTILLELELAGRATRHAGGRISSA